MKTTKNSFPLLISSVFLIICAAWNGIWKFIALALKIFSKVESAIDSNFDYTSLDGWIGLLKSGSAVGTVMGVFHTFLTMAVSFLEVVGGIVGIIFVCLVISNHNTKWNFIPFILGIITDIIGFLAFITLCFSSFISFGLIHIVMLISLLVMPIIFTVYSARFKNETDALPV